MSVGSIFELYLLQFGWQLYGIIWGVIVATGLAYLPFFAVIVDTIVKPLESQEAKAAAATSLRRLEIGVVSICLAMMLAISPSMPLHISDTSASSNICGERMGYQDANETYFGQQFMRADGAEITLPPWFYILLSLMGGVNDAVIAGLPCDTDMRNIAHQVSTLSITNDLLRHDVAKFTAECYRPGIAWIRNERISEAQEATARGDTAWVGSQFLLDSFYKTEWAKNPVPSFAFDPSRQSDMAYTTGKGNHIDPENGFPSCYEWWMTEPNGIRARLVDEFPPNLYHRINHIMQEGHLRHHQDVAIKNALNNEPPIVGDFAMASNQSWGDYFSSLATGAGGIFASVLAAPVLYGIKFAAPLIQSMFLMFVYMFLPMIMLFGKFSFASIIQASVFIVGVKFWSSIWAVLNIIDDQMLGVIKSMSGTDGLASLSNEMVLLKVTFDLLILSFYVAMPFFFMQTLSWAGHKAGDAGTQATAESMSAGKESGTQAGKTF